MVSLPTLLNFSEPRSAVSDPSVAYDAAHGTWIEAQHPTFGPDGPTVEVVVKSSDADELEAASSWLEEALQRSANRAAAGR